MEKMKPPRGGLGKKEVNYSAIQSERVWRMFGLSKQVTCPTKENGEKAGDT